MNRRQFVAAAAASLTTSACGLFDEKKTRLPGERISVLGLDRSVEPDPKLANTPVALPAAAVNPDWPEPGGNPAHAMGNPALGNQVKRVWDHSIGDGSARYTRVMSQPVIAKGQIFAMDGGTQVSALDAGGGGKIWQIDLKPEKLRGTAFGGGPCFWN